MYAAKVKLGLTATTNITSSPAPGARPDEVGLADSPDVIAFSAGNPRVEHITGVVHLFKEVPTGPQAGPVPALPDGHGSRICVLSLPPEFGIADFCTFLGAFSKSVREMRMVRSEANKSQCLVFLNFDSVKQAALFYKAYNGKAFSSLEPDSKCRLVFIKDLELVSGDDCKALQPPAGQTELPSCPVCLERLDQHISGIVTTVCNHKFHSDCLRQWGDESCPVCRYCASTTTSNCATCGTSQDLWICLICGHVGCGRYKAQHSIDHWKESSHVYALELETQRVWDYVGDGYVHRLIQSKTDGKLVEVPPPATSSSRGHLPDACSGLPPSGQTRSDADLQEAIFASKVDAFAQEYNHLLVSQLDSQRQYYEGLLRDKEAQRESTEAQAVADSNVILAKKAHTEIKQAQQAQKTVERKLMDANVKLSETRKERDLLKTLNESLLQNTDVFRKRMLDAEQATKEAKAKVIELEDQVRDLMIFLEARDMVSNSKEDLQQGSVSVAPTPRPRRNRRN